MNPRKQYARLLQDIDKDLQHGDKEKATQALGVTKNTIISYTKGRVGNAETADEIYTFFRNLLSERSKKLQKWQTL